MVFNKLLYLVLQLIIYYEIYNYNSNSYQRVCAINNNLYKLKKKLYDNNEKELRNIFNGIKKLEKDLNLNSYYNEKK